jgi:hypothetical protein
MQEEMTVAFDQARQQRFARKVHLTRTRWRGHISADRDDALAFDEHTPTFVERGAIEYARGAQQDGSVDRFGGRRLQAKDRRGGEQKGSCKQFHGDENQPSG